MIDHLNGYFAVELVDQVVALGDDRVFVPLGYIGSDGFGFLRDPLIAFGVDDDYFAVLTADDSAALVVEHGIFCVGVMYTALVAADGPGADVLQLFAAVLNAGVVAAFADLRCQFKVFDRSAPPD